MCLRASPHPITALCPFNDAVVGHICCVLNVGDLDLFSDNVVTVLFPFDENVVGLNICVDDSFVVESGDPAQSVSQNPLCYFVIESGRSF